MKQRKRWLGLAFAPFALALLAFAPSAQANDFSGTCAQYPGTYDGTGNVTINNTGACTLPAITAGGFIHITSSGAITAQALTAGTDLDIKTTGGAITTQALTTSNGDLKITSATNITTTGAVSSRYAIQANANSGKIAISGNLASNQSGTGGNILLVATGNISTGSISTNSGGGTAGVEIHANTNAAGGTFTIGASTANGVNTTINTSNTTSGGQDPNFVVGGVFITNGNVGSTTAQIKVTNASNINVAASASRSGLIYLDARNGTITLPTGALSSTGPAGQPAGQIILMAGTLKTVNNTVITASQTTAAISTNHGVIVAASNITVAGAGGLKVNGDGNGIAGSPSTAYAQVIPTGGISVSSSAFTSNNVNTMLWTPSLITTAGTNGPVTVSGTGAFTLTANGDYSRAAVYAYPITFSNAAVTISSKGATSHLVDLAYNGTKTGTNGLTLSGTGAVSIDASGSAANDSGGNINVFVDQATINATVPSLTIKADGKGTGNGGIVAFQPTKLVSLAAPTVNVSANGASGSVTFNPTTSTAWGDASITSTTLNLNADGPTSATGNAGTIFFAAANSTFGASTKMKFSAIGPTSGSGNGGNITVFPGNVSGGTFKLGTNAGNLQVLANAGSTGGNGGTINVNPFPGSISIETANALSAAASTGGAANSKGGSVTLIANPSLSVVSSVSGAAVNVDGKGTGDGGTIKIWANGTLNLGSDPGSLFLSAKATGTGNGGRIEIQYITQLTISDLSVEAGIQAGSNGKGGTIDIENIGSLTVNSSVIRAMGRGDGEGGHVTLNATLPVNIVTLSVDASAGSSGTGQGGFATVSSATGNPGVGIRPNVIFNVNAGDLSPVTIQAGTVSLNGVSCIQWKTGTGTGSTSWPKAYWNCAHAVPESYETAVPNAVLGIPVSFRNLLGTHEVPMYIFQFTTNFESFFKGETAENVLGTSSITTPYAVIFEYSGGDNFTSALPASMMHELGHLVDAFTIPPFASDVTAYQTALNSTISAMTGSWPTPQVPTCAQVFGTSPDANALCATHTAENPWEIFSGQFNGGQDTYREMFANAFQVCSGYPGYLVTKEAALRSSYASSLRNYFNTVFWPGGCAP